MSDKSNIEWTDATWNPVTGCSKVSQGCKNCYAERLWPKIEATERKREVVLNWQAAPRRPFTQIRCHEDRLDQPYRWRRSRRIFVNSLSDLFHEDVPDNFIAKIFEVMGNVPQHTYQILTKRPQRMRAWLTSINAGNWPMWLRPWPLPHVWLGVSVEDQATADERIPLLMQAPATMRFISAEPLLGPIDLSTHLGTAANHEDLNGLLRWVIAGGESGPKARPTHPDWIRSLRDQCTAAGVKFFFKQIGEWTWHDEPIVPDARELIIFSDGTICSRADCDKQDLLDIQRRGARLLRRVGKKAAGRELDGRTHDEYPACS